MCTAATYCNGDFYFGRNLDYEFSYGEHVTIMPRNYPIRLHSGALDRHHAMIGMAHIQDDYPLYYDAVNEKGLCIAGLNFVGNAVYPPVTRGVASVAQYALIPWLLGTCANIAEARSALARVVIDGTPFAPELPCAQLHWLVADRSGCIAVEATADGLHVYDDPAGVLTNNPPFPQQMAALRNYTRLSASQPPADFCGVPVTLDSRGMGALGLPGDLSSPSRFVRAAFVRANARSERTEDANVSQFFHILTSVEQQRGCCELDDGQFEITLYSSCGSGYLLLHDLRQPPDHRREAPCCRSRQRTAHGVSARGHAADPLGKLNPNAWKDRGIRWDAPVFTRVDAAHLRGIGSGFGFFLSRLRQRGARREHGDERVEQRGVVDVEHVVRPRAVIGRARPGVREQRRRFRQALDKNRIVAHEQDRLVVKIDRCVAEHFPVPHGAEARDLLADEGEIFFRSGHMHTSLMFAQL